MAQKAASTADRNLGKLLSVSHYNYGYGTLAEMPGYNAAFNPNMQPSVANNLSHLSVTAVYELK